MSVADLEGAAGVSSVRVRVRYAETDQMGVAHHSHYLVWCEAARTEHMRHLGASYRDMEQHGLRLPVVDARVRYRTAARYDDPLEVYCWVREIASRLVAFGYALVSADERRLVATAQTTLMAVDSAHGRTVIPPEIRERLAPIADPIRL